MSTMNRAQLLDSIRGQEVVLPSVKSIFGRWPSTCNQRYDSLTVAIDDVLESFSFTPKKLMKMKAANFALFGSLWWPDAGLEELRIATSLIIWLFVWDDELDQPTGSLINDLEFADLYRLQTIQFVEQSLGIRDHSLQASTLNPLIAGFEPFGEVLKAKCPLTQRKRLQKEIVRYIKSTKPEQLSRFDDEIWTLDKYWRNRLGTSAVGVTSAIIEHTTGTSLPSEIMDSKEMKVIWHETNMIISVVNDILSAKKELALGCLESYIPLACASGATPQSSVDDAVDDLRRRVARFDKAAAALTSRYSKPGKTANPRPIWPRRKLSGRTVRRCPRATDPAACSQRPDHDPSVQRDLQRFIQVSRQNCVGNMEWSLKTRRYDVQDCPRGEDGSIRITL